MQIDSMQQLQELRFSWPHTRCECCKTKAATSFARAEWNRGGDTYMALCAACLFDGASKKWSGGYYVDDEYIFRKRLMHLDHLFTITLPPAPRVLS